MIDIAATVLDVAGLPEPISVNGVQQMPLHGVSMAYSFDDADAAERHETQYFEIFGNRGIYHKGWTAVTRHSTPWVSAEHPAFDDDVWELYAPDDWTQAHDLAAEDPNRLHELQRLFIIEAGKYDVFPLDDRVYERFNADLAGRPAAHPRQLAAAVRRHGPPDRELDPRPQEQVARRHRAARRPRERRERRDHRPGRLLRRLEPVRQGRPAGLLLQPARPAALQGRRRPRDPARRAPGRMEFAYDGGGLGKGGTATLYIDGEPVGEGRIDATQAMIFSGDETTDLGTDAATPVSDDYGPGGSHFTGRVRWVQIDIDDAAEDIDHLISPEERLRIAMARQ